MANPLHLKIFLSSPDDVADERDLARKLIKEELPYDPLLRGKITFDVFSWDDPAAGVPLLANMTPQEAVNRVDRPATCDITVVILWSRLGSPLHIDAFRKPDGEQYLSGTEWEYDDARTANREVVVYRRSAPVLVDVGATDFEERREQHRRLQEFFDRFRNPDGSLKAGARTYLAPADLKDLLAKDLKALIAPRLIGGARDTPTRCYVPASADPVSDEVCFDYSTNNGLVTVGQGDCEFRLRFSKASDTAIHLYKDNTNLSAIARIKGAHSGDQIEFSEHDSSSRVYTIRTGEHFLVVNDKGYFLQGRVTHIQDDTRGTDRDEVRFRYEIGSAGQSRFHAL